ncbi:MAG: hypothetical protein US60_C0001G0005 [Microgenomates group bacterium GW2011_GWC1_37_8]|uniref:Glycosyltransferase RgtA/B/C/D-like domain-containing protein n=1 Tax=Candidatus Woesebacteria bacterium GW2011_GWB1_38_8 TaxID=1618570 RepID=A0A0G0L2L5_9BACT|nr:MAG: hypothetical protein US60_C0001G0005 [Microgenomates group bacterium GW2011_GWC1_37_8]KKQ86208.1 MAG: hypothetical protein UT08_C0001G0074 [Candidatus Woesebacteria bacterium GW2011_GWB1_38_8]
MNKIIVYLVLLAILVIGLNLRRFSYAQVPLPGETADEYSFGWLGISLIKDRYPIAWSGIAGYKNHDFQKINVDRLFDVDPGRPPFSIDKPWFDHPPLFGLVTGGFAYLSGVRNFENASVLILRRPMLIIGVLNILLIFILANMLYGEKVALLSSAIYSFSPLIVISSRLALAENGYIPLFLLSLIIMQTYIKKKNIGFWYTVCILAGISLLFKLSAIAIPITLATYITLIKKKIDYKLLLPLILSTIGALLIFTIYGAIFDLGVFFDVIKVNSERIFGAGSEIFYQAVSISKITTQRTFTDGWILLGWISFFMLIFRNWKKDVADTLIGVSVLSYLFVFLFFGSEPYGWYRFPLYPFLAIASAKVIYDLFRQNRLLTSYALLLIPFGTSAHRLLGFDEFLKYASFFRSFTLLVFLIFIINIAFNNKFIKISKLLILFALIFVFFLSIKEVYFYNVDNWYFST